MAHFDPFSGSLSSPDYQDMLEGRITWSYFYVHTQAPDFTPLPFSRHETEEVKRICQSAKLTVIEQHHKKPVLDALASCKISHFADHGFSDPIDPLQSCLLLGDREEDRLTLASFIWASALEQSPFLAYLSACSTSQIENERVIDEGLHLINAFQLAESSRGLYCEESYYEDLFCGG